MSTGSEMVTQGGGSMVRREEFDALETRGVVETASSAVAAAAQAEVHARWLIAMRTRRSWDRVRVEMLKECERPSFAESSRYDKPVGQSTVSGFSIRFVEAAMRIMGNILTNVSAIYDDDQKRIVRVSVTDLEANVTHPQEVTISKTVERRNPNGATVVSSRRNKKGDLVYTVAATDDDILNKQNALVSKALRTLGLRLIPGDLQDECEERVAETRTKKIKEDPDAARKKVVDAFFALNVPPDQLQEYLGHDLGICSPAEIDKLRSIAMAIKDGEATWAEVMETVTPAGDGEGAEKKMAQAQSELATKLEQARAKRDAAKGKDKPAADSNSTEQPKSQAKPAEPSKADAKPIDARLKAAIDARAKGIDPKAPMAYFRRIRDALEVIYGDISKLTGDKIDDCLSAVNQVEVKQ